MIPKYGHWALICLTFAPAPVRAQPVSDRPAALRYLYSLLTPSGGYLANTPPPNVRMRPTLRATLAAIRAIKYNGGEPRHADRSAQFVSSCRHSQSGGFSDTPGGEPSLAATCVGIMAAIELEVPADTWRDGAMQFLNERAKSFDERRLAAAAFESLNRRTPRAADWLADLSKSQNADGTFGAAAGAARYTGGATAMILRLGGKLANRDAVLRVIRTGQRPDGGFGKAESPKQSDLESTYRVVRALAMLNEKPADIGKLRTFIESCRNADGGFGEAPGQMSSASGTYHAAIVTHWLSRR